jgi:hypothetical protein
VPPAGPGAVGPGGVPPGFPPGPPGGPPGAPFAPVTKSRGRVPLILGGVILTIVLIVVLVSVLQGGPELTFDGESLDRPEETLTAAERHLRSFTEERNGATNDETRCYFSLRNDEGSDVRDYLRCGPVLFVDGSAEEPYLTFSLDAQQGDGDRVRLVAAEEPRQETPERLPRDEQLRRPDGSDPPEGAGGLEPPPPPRAEPGLIEVSALDGVDTENPGADARLGALHIGYRLTGIAQPDRFGQGAEARRPAEGETFVAARFEVEPGEAASGLGATGAQVTVQVGDEEPVPVPDELLTPFSTEGLIVSVPDGTERVDLIVNDGGVEQRLDLLEGRTGRNNVAVLRRDNREQTLSATANLTFTASRPGYIPENFTVTPTAEGARLFWHYPADGSEPTLHPAGGDRAYLVPLINFGWDPRLGVTNPDEGLPPAFFTLRLPDGQVVPAIDIDPNTTDQWFVVAFEVGADFTEGTISIGGASLLFDDITIDFGPSRLDIPVSIPEG